MATTTPPTAPQRPDPLAVQARVDRYVRRVVTPYLQHCLDTAQAKTRYPLRFNQQMGVTCLYCAAAWERGSWDTPEIAGALADDGYVPRDCRDKVARLRAHFPELEDLFRVVYALGDLYTDDLTPTVPPRADDGRRDPADLVEEGPLVACHNCPAAGVDGDFLVDGDGRRPCARCHNDLHPRPPGRKPKASV